MQETAKQNQQTVFTVEDKEQTQVTKYENNEVPFEEALNMTGVGRYTVGLFVACVVTVLAMAMETFGTSYVATACACDLRLSTATKGLVSAMPMLGIVLSSHLWGWLADTRGRRFVLLVSMGGCFVAALASSLANNWVTLAVFKFVAAFFASASNAVSYALLGESTPTSHRHTLVMMMTSGLMLAQFVMSVNAYPILRLSFDLPLYGSMRYRPWRLLEQVFGVWSGVAALIMLVFVKESPKFYASQGRPDMSVKILAEIYAVNTGKSQDSYAVKSISFHETLASTKQTNVLRSMWDQTTPLFRKPLLFKTIIILYIVILVYSISPAFLMWMPTLATAFSRATAAGATDANFCQLLHYANQAAPGVANGTVVATTKCVDTVEDLAFITMIAFSITMASVNMLNSYLTRYVGKRALVIFLHLLGGTCGLVLPWVYNSTASLIVFFLFQANLIAMGLTTGFTVEVYPTYLRAMAVCLTMMVGRGSSFLVISYVGVLMETHCDYTFYAFGVIVLSGALVGLWLPSELKPGPDSAAGSDGSSPTTVEQVKKV
ncbi:uncharacterized protein LOC105384544 [Plutella xylostella]|uniref:uncharacterized protein LOC105384544 n=1 Tax=Plutella xylostella TaxID=51655 RepID=UPI002032FA96|nr:uncharacterized protein LOC105384544 [Plutella xylostella]